jgi:8-amino-7-oxononanoate synthase
MDIFDKARTWTDAREAQEMGVYPFFIAFEDSEGTVARYEGREIIMIGSNNYLGLTTHPKVRQASIDAVKRFGTSCTGSRFGNGTLTMHNELERRLAAYVQKDAAIVFSTGYQTNVGTITALIGRGDVAITDKEDHASIIDACQMSLGEMKRFRHNDVEDLDRVLSGIPDKAGRLVIVDGVYSMAGDIAPLPEMAKVCKKYDARLMVDDAHSLGVLGGGRGTAAHFGLTDEVDLIMGTFSKSFASIGGFIAGDEEVIHYIQHHARSLIFSASLPPANVASVLAALDIMENEPEHVERLWENTRFMHEGYTARGFDIGGSTTPVVPIYVRDMWRTILFWKALFEEGIYCNPVFPPGVPPNQSLLRTSYMATHTKEQLSTVLDIFETVGKRIDII